MRLGKLTAVGAAATGLGLVAAPASALTITYGGSNPITATLNGTSVFWVGGQQLSCSGSSMTATVHAGTSNPAATITAASWSGCTFASSSFGPLPATMTVSSPNWPVNAVSGMTNAANDHAISATIDISNLTVGVQGPVGNCTFGVPGRINAVFDEDNGNGDQELTPITLGSTLSVSNVNSSFACLGLVNNGHAASWASAYITSTAAGAINIEP